MNKIEKFTEADVFGNNENDKIVDEGIFTPNGFHSTLLTTDSPDVDCDCESRKEHEQHLSKICKPAEI